MFYCVSQLPNKRIYGKGTINGCIEVYDMKYDNFCESLLDALREEFGEEYNLELREVMKNNDQKMKGFVILNDRYSVSPTFYLKNLYEEYQNGESLSGIVEEICNLYQMTIKKNQYASLDFSYQNCRERVVFRLVSKEKNQQILSEVPHIPFLDLAIMFYLVIENTNSGLSSVRITNQMMEQWEKTPHDLYCLAKKNTERLFPVRIEPIMKLMMEMTGKNKESEFYAYIEANENHFDNNVFVITNESGLNGAASILFRSTLQKVGEILEGDFYLLPSSIHEVLALSINTSIDYEQLKQMVSMVNEECVSPEEVLSNQVYFYDCFEKKLSLCDE